MEIRWTQLIAIFWSIAELLSCATSPTGRRQMNLVSDEQMAQMGSQSFEEVKRKERVEQNYQVNARVRCISKHVLNVIGTDPDSWEIVVFNSKTINAFALPGKKIGVYTGIIDLAENDAQLAAVIGHEVGHVIARHSNERVSQAMGEQLAMGALAAVFSENTTKNQAILMGAMGLIHFGVMLPYSRTHETEADELGQDYMAKAGYDPQQAARFWEVMKKKSGGGPPEILSTHPSPDSRIEELKSHARKLMPVYERAPKPSC